MSTKGVYCTKLKNGKSSFRASLTAGGKHISLGSFDSEKKAGDAYLWATKILSQKKRYPIDALESLAKKTPLSHEKLVVLCNLRDNGLYFSTPIYIRQNFFYYYLSPSDRLVFDKEDLFYYSTRKIMQRGSHLFVADYGMQVTIATRYGIRPFAVKGRDYLFRNGDDRDFRYSNIEIINPYHGVLREGDFGQYRYKALIHIKGNRIIGVYDDLTSAAIAYNKAADLCKRYGIEKDYPVNYIENISPREYAEHYDSIQFAAAFDRYIKKLSKSRV
ncbi:MAG: hypothetical protein K5739_12820 [Lachnospiraceae bacterium]|nr:hypothetical protein [Lachnospiraceae bacterium]